MSQRDPTKDLNVGTPLYMAPETLLENTYNIKSDVWAIGVLYYELLHGVYILIDQCTIRHSKRAGTCHHDKNDSLNSLRRMDIFRIHRIYEQVLADKPSKPDERFRAH